MILLLRTLIITTLLFCSTALAQNGDNQSEISIFATTCEKIINGESKSSARVRASDKASFKAVEEIPELSKYRAILDAHNFNLKVYRLVDNYIEDIKITVINQNDSQVCVEVSAYLQPSSIKEVFSEEDKMLDPIPELQDELSLDIEEDAIDDKIDITIPPKPDITINEQIAYEDVNSLSEHNITANITKQDNISLPQKDNKSSVFIDKTEFYNDTSTNGFFGYMEREVLKKDDIKVIAQLDNPDYILKAKVLKAKIDNINSETGRLQIVIALELTDTASSKTVTEHQNRFILFNSTDNTQDVAMNLTKDLIATGIAKLLPQIKNKNSANISGSIITPN